MPTMIEKLVNLLFPPKCVFCRQTLPIATPRDTRVCTSCERTLPYTLAQRRCQSCGRPMKGGYVHCEMCRSHPRKPFSKLCSAYLYQGQVKTSIVRFKQEVYRGYAKVFARHMEAVISYDLPDVVFDGILSVPPRKLRMKANGYDQAASLAQALGERMEVPYLPNVLRQRENRKKQSALTAAERWHNAEGNVRVACPELVAGKVLLLVDDVCTTGATMYAAAAALSEAGAKKVYCAVAASAEKR